MQDLISGGGGALPGICSLAVMGDVCACRGGGRAGGEWQPGRAAEPEVRDVCSGVIYS